MMLILFLLLYCAILLPSCVQQPIEILDIETELVYYYDVTASELIKRLSVFLLLPEETRLTDIERLTIISPGPFDLRWEIESDLLRELRSQGACWVGTNTLRVVPKPDGKKSFASGTYELELLATSGLSSRIDFSVSDPLLLDSRSLALFPRYDAQKDRIVYPAADAVRLRCYSGAKVFVGSFDASTADSVLDQLREQGSLSEFPVYIELEVLDPLLGLAFRSGWYRL